MENKEKIFAEEYTKYYDLLNSDKNYGQECTFLEEIFEKYSGSKIKNILNLGCGTGLHDKELVLKGYDITGLDLSEKMIKIAKQRVPNAKFVVGDMSNFELNEKFDCIICMFSSIGYLTENNQLAGFFKSVKKHLKEKGLLVIDCWNGLGVMRELPSIRDKIVESGEFKIIKKSFPILDAKNHLNKVKFNIKVLLSLFSS